MPKHKAALKDLLHKGVQNLDSGVQILDSLVFQQPHELYVNEPGLYSLIFRSKLPKAEAFTATGKTALVYTHTQKQSKAISALYATC